MRKLAAVVDSTRIVVLDDFSSSYRWNLPHHALLDVVEGSILDEQKLKQVFYKKPDYVFHLAAHFANQNSIDHPETDLMVNGLGLLKVLEYSRLVKPAAIRYYPQTNQRWITIPTILQSSYSNTFL